jgi:type II secretory pathway component PulF
LIAAAAHLVAFLGAILFGCAILLAVQVLSGGARERRDSLQQALQVAGWVLILAGGLAVLLIAGLIPAGVAVVVLPAVVHRRRRAQRYALLSAMVVGFERRIGVIPILLAFASERRGYVSRRAMDLAARLQAGWALPDAVDATGGLFAPDIRLAIRMGYGSGRLAQVLRELVDRADNSDAIDAQVAGKATYLVIVLQFLLMIGVFLMLKIVPALQRIFEEFGVELPGLTILMVKVAHFATAYWFLALALWVPLTLAACHGILRYMGAIERDLPGTTWLRRRMHAAALLDTLAVFTRADRPIADGIAALAQWYPVASIRMRLARAHGDVLGGADWCASLARRRLISDFDRGVLEAAQRVGNLPWAMAEMAEGNRRRHTTRAVAMIQSAFVAILLCYGLFVFLLFVGNFMPLVKLITVLT